MCIVAWIHNTLCIIQQVPCIHPLCCVSRGATARLHFSKESWNVQDLHIWALIWDHLGFGCCLNIRWIAEAFNLLIWVFQASEHHNILQTFCDMIHLFFSVRCMLRSPTAFLRTLSVCCSHSGALFHCYPAYHHNAISQWCSCQFLGENMWTPHVKQLAVPPSQTRLQQEVHAIVQKGINLGKSWFCHDDNNRELGMGTPTIMHLHYGSQQTTQKI